MGSKYHITRSSLYFGFPEEIVPKVIFKGKLSLVESGSSSQPGRELLVVINSSFLLVSQDTISFSDFSKIVQGFLLRILVRMILEGQLPEGLPNVLTGGPLGQPQGPIVVLHPLAGGQQ